MTSPNESGDDLIDPYRGPGSPAPGSPAPGDTARGDSALGAVVGERRRLLNLAYRLLGSVSDAEDVVQEAYARWFARSAAERAAVASPGGWLTRVAGRICLDVLGSARVRRERYVGQWVPEPLPDRGGWLGGRPRGGGGEGADPADLVALDESVSMAFLVVLDLLTPAERVAFVLHDVFGHTFGEVAGIVGRSELASRQLASSARRRIRAARPLAADGVRAATAPERAGLVREFKRAWEAKDIAALVGLLDPRATMVVDGGGVAGAALRPVVGGERIARFTTQIVDRSGGLAIHEASVNGHPGLTVRRSGTTDSVIAFDTTRTHVTRLWAVRNPAKLRLWIRGPVAPC